MVYFGISTESKIATFVDMLFIGFIDLLNVSLCVQILHCVLS